MKASKVKVHMPPDEADAREDKLFVYVYDVFNKEFHGGEEFAEIEKAAAFQRHEQERIYTVQEADPELFDLPFVSSDPKLLDNVKANAEYKDRLMKALDHEARARAKHR